MKGILNQVQQRLKKLQQLRRNHQERQKPISKNQSKTGAEKAGNAQEMELTIATDTVLKILVVMTLFGGLLVLMYQLQTILIMTLVAFFLSMGLAPIVDYLERWKLPRPLAIFLIYISFFGIIGLMFTTAVPIIIEQLLDLSRDLRNVLSNNPAEGNSWLGTQLRELNFDPSQFQDLLSQNLTDMANQLRGVAGSTLGWLGDIFAGFFNLIFTMVLMFFILLEKEKIGHFAMQLLPSSNRAYWEQKFTKAQGKIGDWFRGQLILMFSLGAFMYVGMKIFEWAFDMKYAFTIALVTAVMSLFPYIGVFITGLLCVLIAVNISWGLVIAVIIWIAISQMLEGNVLAPMIMEKTTGLSSVVILLSLSSAAVLGAAVGGVGLAVIAMILAVPVAASVSIFVEEYTQKEH